MLTDSEITYEWNKDNPDERGAALAFIIDEDVVYAAPFYNWAADMILRADSFVEISQDNASDSLVVSIIENGVELDQLETTEYFGSILLSSPIIKDLNSYPYGRYVYPPNAKFVNDEFIFPDMSVEGLPPFITEEEIAERMARFVVQENA
jgi:hypothetical protein